MNRSPECPSRQEFGQAVVAFLHRTHLFYQASVKASALVWPGESPGSDNGTRWRQDLEAEMNASVDTVNAGIIALGGLPLSITDTGSGLTLRCTAETWYGYDPDPKTKGNLLWHIKGTPPEQIMSVSPDIIDQLQGEFS